MPDRKASPISEGIRAAIRASGRSVYSIAADVECSPQQLYNFLGRKRGLSLEVLDRLGDVLGLEVTRRPAGAGRSMAEVASCEADAAVPGEGGPPACQRDEGLIEPAPALPAQEPSPEGQASGTPTPTAKPKLILPGRRLLPGLGKSLGPLRAGDVDGALRRGLIPVWVKAHGMTPDTFLNHQGQVDPPHTNAAQADTYKMLELWGPDVTALYKAQTIGKGRKPRPDTQARKNIYNFLSVLSRNPDTQKHLRFLNGLPMANILNWVQAFPPEKQMQIATKLPCLDDGGSGEDTEVPTRFWERVDEASFFKAVEALGFVPDPHLKARYLHRKGRPAPDDAPDSHEEEADDPVSD